MMKAYYRMQFLKKKYGAQIENEITEYMGMIREEMDFHLPFDSFIRCIGFQKLCEVDRVLALVNYFKRNEFRSHITKIPQYLFTGFWAKVEADQDFHFNTHTNELYYRKP